MTENAETPNEQPTKFEDVLEQEQERVKKSEKKTTKADKKLAEALAERDDFKDKYQRTFSDFNNFRKRMATSRAEALRDGRCDTIENLLPVLDSFERALEHIEGEDSALVQGFTMVYRQLTEAIEKMGVKEIPALGEVFDPNRHQAIQMADAQEGQVSGTVAAVVQKGYAMEDRIIRPSMVIVNK